MNHQPEEFAKYVRHLTITTIVVDPEPLNLAAIKCYEKVGFVEVGTYTTEFGPALLMKYELNKQ